MPFSWMRVPGNTSPKVRRCMGDDHSKVRFEACVKDIVADDGGRVDQLWFELNGTFAHVPAGELALDVNRGLDRVVRALERREERVALRVDLFTPMCCEHLPQEALLIGQQFPVQASA